MSYLLLCALLFQVSNSNEFCPILFGEEGSISCSFQGKVTHSYKGTLVGGNLLGGNLECIYLNYDIRLLCEDANLNNIELE